MYESKIFGKKEELNQLQNKIEKVEKDFRKAESANQNTKKWFEKKLSELKTEEEKLSSDIKKLEEKQKICKLKLKKTA